MTQSYANNFTSAIFHQPRVRPHKAEADAGAVEVERGEAEIKTQGSVEVPEARSHVNIAKAAIPRLGIGSNGPEKATFDWRKPLRSCLLKPFLPLFRLTNDLTAGGQVP